jgi:glyoxylase-like metal-dependent hydrolase (beta-lactamase superfamily II)
MTRLGYATYVAPEKPVVSSDPAPGLPQEVWSPTSATLIYGEHDAVLVDALLTEAEGRDLANWVAATGKNLTTIYITHGHGDHFFGASEVLSRFPDARLVATSGVVDTMREHQAAGQLENFWRPRFPDQIIAEPPVAQPLTEPFIELEGEQLEPIQLGHSDTDHTTALHAPSIDLLVAGDSVYNDVHLYLNEAGEIGIGQWLRALDIIDSLNPATVIAGHKREGAPDGPENIDATRRYLMDWDAAVALTEDACQLFDTFIERYPERLNRSVVWHSAEAFKP